MVRATRTGTLAYKSQNPSINRCNQNSHESKQDEILRPFCKANQRHCNGNILLPLISNMFVAIFKNKESIPNFKESIDLLK